MKKLSITFGPLIQFINFFMLIGIILPIWIYNGIGGAFLLMALISILGSRMENSMDEVRFGQRIANHHFGQRVGNNIFIWDLTGLIFLIFEIILNLTLWN